MGGVDAGDPVAQCLVHRVLQRATAGADRHHLRTQQAHPGDVQRLPPGVLLAHVHTAFEIEIGRDRGRRHAVLARSGLGDQPGLAHPLGEQALPEHVADLVRTGVVQVLALEPDLAADGGRQPARECQHAGKPGVVRLHRSEFVDERRVVDGGPPGQFELVERRDQRLRHEPAAEDAEVTAGVGYGWRGCDRVSHAGPPGARAPRPGRQLLGEGPCR